VVDTNVALNVYLEEDLADEAQRVLDAGRDGDAELLAPTLILPEFRQELTKRVRREEITASRDSSATAATVLWTNCYCRRSRQVSEVCAHPPQPSG
jgi:predicted nucleic acid-binding protein